MPNGASDSVTEPCVHARPLFTASLLARATAVMLSCSTLFACSGGIGSTDTSSSVAASEFTVGGSASGLSGSGLQLQDNGGDTLSLSANGTFHFATPLITGDSYAVSILTQPTGPSQNCVIANNAGQVGTVAVTSVTVTCTDKTTTADTLGGTATGVLGTGLVLQNNGADNLSIAASGAFTFSSALTSGASYDVSVLSPPLNPYQNCVVGNAVGIAGASNISDVSVSCTTNSNPTYTIGGNVSGVTGAGTLILQDNGRDNLTITADGPFKFPIPIPTGSSFNVTSLSLNGQQSQACQFNNASGIVAGSNITNITIQCQANVAVTVSVSGLTGTGLILQDNIVDSLVVNANGKTAFANAVPSNTQYSVTVAGQPVNPAQTCAVANGTGTAKAGSTISVAVTCTTPVYRVGGTVAGLQGTGLTLVDNGGSPLAVNAAGAFAFATPVASGQKFAVSVTAQPKAPSQTCTVAGADGTVASAAVTSVAVTCVTNSYTVGGTITGLTGSGLILQNNSGNSLPVNPAPGGGTSTFVFSAPLASGTAYLVSVAAPPNLPTQTCVVVGGKGIVTNGAVNTVAISCSTNKYSIGGTVSGLNGTGLVLQDNLGNNLPVAKNGAFTFTGLLASGSSYSVSVAASPVTVSQVCTITQGTGPVTSANVTSVAVTCVTSSFTVGGTLSGLPAQRGFEAATPSISLQDNLGNAQTITENGLFALAAVPSGSPYSVTISAYPAGYACAVASGTGTVTTAPITSIVVSCSPIGGYLYVTNEGGGNISGFAIDADTGALQPLTGIVAPAGQPNAIVAAAPGGSPRASIAGCTTANADTLYVSDGAAGSPQISAFTVDTADTSLPLGGTLALIGNSTYPTAGELAWTYLDINFNINEDGCGLYALTQNTAPKDTYVLPFSSIGGGTGALTAVANPVAYAGGAQPIAAGNIDVTYGNFEYVASKAPNEISVYTVGTTGALTLSTNPNQDPGDNPATLASAPTAIAVTEGTIAEECSFAPCTIPTIPFVYAAVPATATTSNIVELQGDATSGYLSPLASVAGGVGPTAMTIFGNLLFVTNGGGNNVSVYVINSTETRGSAGTLTPLTATFPTGSNPIALTSAYVAGTRYLYVANKGSNTVTAFSVDSDPASNTYGVLTLIGTYAVGLSPSSIAIPYTLNDDG